MWPQRIEAVGFGSRKVLAERYAAAAACQKLKASTASGTGTTTIPHPVLWEKLWSCVKLGVCLLLLPLRIPSLCRNWVSWNQTTFPRGRRARDNFLLWLGGGMRMRSMQPRRIQLNFLRDPRAGRKGLFLSLSKRGWFPSFWVKICAVGIVRNYIIYSLGYQRMTQDFWKLCQHSLSQELSWWRSFRWHCLLTKSE